jgi:hypothetical protein
MTIGLAWVGRRKDGREHLYIGSDSRVTGGLRWDACPKILTLPRSDCALCWAGESASTYPLMIQVANAIAAHEPARERSMDIARVKAHLLRVFTDTIQMVKDAPLPFDKSDAQFIFAGYSWLQKDFRIWTIYYSPESKSFAAREALHFHPRLSKAAFIGDWSKRVRASMIRELNKPGGPFYLEPLRVLAETLRLSGREDTVGGLSANAAVRSWLTAVITITSKVVLILGRFTPERKVVLDRSR